MKSRDAETTVVGWGNATLRTCKDQSAVESGREGAGGMHGVRRPRDRAERQRACSRPWSCGGIVTAESERRRGKEGHEKRGRDKDSDKSAVRVRYAGGARAASPAAVGSQNAAGASRSGASLRRWVSAGPGLASRWQPLGSGRLDPLNTILPPVSSTQPAPAVLRRRRPVSAAHFVPRASIDGAPAPARCALSGCSPSRPSPPASLAATAL